MSALGSWMLHLLTTAFTQSQAGGGDWNDKERKKNKGSKSKARMEVGRREIWASSDCKALFIHIYAHYVYNNKSYVNCKILLFNGRNSDVLDRK